jgi:hypothetical protein
MNLDKLRKIIEARNQGNYLSMLTREDILYVNAMTHVDKALVEVATQAERFIPDPATIQWERREVALKLAYEALTKAIEEIP